MTLNYGLDRRWLVAAGAALAVVTALTFAAVATPHMATLILTERGPIESLSALLHFGAMALALVWRRRAPGLLGLLAICAFLMGGRELDWHKAFTTHGIFSTKLYFYDTVPLAEKVIAGAFVVVLLTLLVMMAARSRHDLRRLVAERSPAIWGLATLVAILPVIKLIDGLPRMVREAGGALDAGVVKALLSVEEIGEMALPLLMMLLILQIARRKEPALP
jgi:hypothetical protein